MPAHLPAMPLPTLPRSLTLLPWRSCTDFISQCQDNRGHQRKSSWNTKQLYHPLLCFCPVPVEVFSPPLLSRSLTPRVVIFFSPKCSLTLSTASPLSASGHFPLVSLRTRLGSTTFPHLFYFPISLPFRENS